MKAEIINVGSEILIGDILNTNSKYLSFELSRIGVDVLWHVSVGDNYKRLKEAIYIALERSDILVFTGGLGSTKDDITKEVVSNALSIKLVEDEKIKKKIELIFKNIGKEVPLNNFKQSMVFEGSLVFENENGVAPALVLQYKGKLLILLPGPPDELIPLFEKYVKPYIKSFSDSVILSKNVNIFGIMESEVDEMISDILMGENPTVGIYAKPGEVRLRVTAKAKDKAICENMIDIVIANIKKRLKKYIYGIDVKNMQTAMVEAFKLKNKTFSVAESCTGGLIASSVVQIDGVSSFFKMGVVCYSNESKQNILGINKKIIDRYGAVSFEVAKEMAIKVRKLSKTFMGISTTGVAGPFGGTKKKPVGLVYIAISTEKETRVYKLFLSKGRENERNEIRKRAALFAMNKARETVLYE